MKSVTKKYEMPGEYDCYLPFNKEGEERNWLGIIDARRAGNYSLVVTTNHLVPQTKGRVTIRGVVGKGATLDVTGLIKIAKEAQKTDDFLEVRILLLDKTSRATAEPKLEIEADEVKASHAASVGRIDKEQILYLMSRGLSEEQAKNAIVVSFLGEV